MLSLKTTPDDEAILKFKLDQFERWHTIRMVFQMLTAFALLWAVVVMH